MGRLGFDDVPRSVFKTNDDQFRQLDELFADFGSDDSDCLVVLEPAQNADLFTPAGVAAIRRVVAAAQAIPGVASVRSLADVVLFDQGLESRSLLPADGAPAAAYVAARRAALAHPLIRGQVLAPDGCTALVVVRLVDDLVAIGSLSPVVDQLRSAVAQSVLGTPVVARLTGVPPIRVEIFSAVQRESKRFIVIGAMLAFGMGMLLFREVWSALIAASAPILAAFWTLGLVGLAGEKLNVINTVLPTLVMVVGFADAMHVLIDIRHARAAGASPRAAARQAIRHLFVTCLLTASTTAVGFGALMLAELDIIRRFGLVCAAGSMLAFVSVMTLVPLLSTTWIGAGLGRNEGRDFIARNFRHFERAIDWLMRHARPVTVVGTLVTLALSVSLFWLRPDNRLVELIPHHNESYQALAHLDRVLGGSLAVFALIEWPLEQPLVHPPVLEGIRAARDVFASESALHHPVSLCELLAAMPGAPGDSPAKLALLPLVPADVARRYIRPDLHRALVIGRLPDAGTSANQPVYRRLSQQLGRLEHDFPGMKFRLTGTSVVASRNINKMIESLNQSLLGAGVVIFGSIALGFRSVRLGAISVLPNVFPMAATAFVLVVSGRPLQITSVIVFSVCLGIAVDDTIHFLNRFRREMEIDGDVEASIRRAFLAVGSAVVTTTLVLLVGFGSVLTSEMPASRLFGGLSCVAYATAIVGDLFLLPALLVTFMPRRAQPAGPQAPGEIEMVGDQSPGAGRGETEVRSLDP